MGSTRAWPRRTCPGRPCPCRQSPGQRRDSRTGTSACWRRTSCVSWGISYSPDGPHGEGILGVGPREDVVPLETGAAALRRHQHLDPPDQVDVREDTERHLGGEGVGGVGVHGPVDAVVGDDVGEDVDEDAETEGKVGPVEEGGDDEEKDDEGGGVEEEEEEGEERVAVLKNSPGFFLEADGE